MDAAEQEGGAALEASAVELAEGVEAGGVDVGDVVPHAEDHDPGGFSTWSRASLRLLATPKKKGPLIS